MTDRDQLLKDYAAIIDEQRKEIAKLNKQIVKMLEEFREIEQILGKALMYPWFKDDQENFPNATEADGVAIGDHTAWSLAMCAADKIKELQKQLDKEYERGYQEGVDAEYERNNFRKD
jgi:ribosome biogenesis GTPase A